SRSPCGSASARTRAASFSRAEYLLKILVSAAREAEQDELLVELGDPRQRVGGLERREDPFRPRQPPARGERFLVRGGGGLGAAGVAQERVLRTGAGVVQAGGDRLGIEDLAVLVGEHGRARAVQDGGAAGTEARGAAGLHSEQANRVVEEGREQTDRVR